MGIICHNLDVPKAFMASIAAKLVSQGIVKSVRGPSGGFELAGNPTVGTIIRSLGPPTLVAPQDMASYRRGELEHRSLYRLVEDFNFALFPVFTRTVKSVVEELVRAELAAMDRAAISREAN